MSLVVSHMEMKSTTPLPVTAGLAGGAVFFRAGGLAGAGQGD
jgi:hypothetical protein